MNTKDSAVRILHLEDNDNDAELIQRTLSKAGMALEMTRAINADSYFNALQRGAFDLILSDYSMPGFNGASALALAKKECPDTPFVFVSGTVGEEAAIESLKRGAANYVLKDRLHRLVPAVQTALEEAADRRRLQHAEGAVRERAKFFRLISENVTDLVAVLDLEGRRLYTSPSYQTLFGKDNLRGTDSFADIHPDDRQRMQQLFKQTIQTGCGQRAEFRFLLKDGTLRYIESHGGVIQGPDGKPCSVIVVSKDVTKRKLAERALRDSEERFRSVMQAAHDAIVLADGDGNILGWNSAAQRVFGYTEEEVRGKSLQHLLAPAGHDGHQPAIGLNSAASRFVAVCVEAQGRRKDGCEFPVEVTVSTWKTGAETYYSAIFRDISERHGVRQVLTQLRRRNDVLLNAAGEGICGLDEDGTITFANPAAARMLGYYVDDLAGLQFYHVVSRLADDPPQAAEQSAFSLTLKDGTERRSASQVFRKRDGSSFAVEYVVTPVRDKEHVIGAVVVFKDITERQQIEERLREQAALLDNATDAICVINMDASVIYWNKSAERLYGWTAPEVVGKVAPDLLFKSEGHGPSQAFKTLIENRNWEGELRQRTKTGRELIVQSRWTLLHDRHGAPKSILVINSDITEKKALEAQLSAGIA